jgi:hypothetical protein
MSFSNNSSVITYDDFVLSDNENEENEEKKDDYTSESDFELEDINEQENEEKKVPVNFQFVGINNNEKSVKKRLIQTKKKKDMEDCQICADKYNNSTRKEVKCLFCNYSSCKSCYEQYLLQSNDSICMNCKTVWNREFLDKNFTKVFLKGKYKKRREEVLMERQKALLQSTLPIAEIRSEAKKRYSVVKDRRIEILNQNKLTIYSIIEKGIKEAIRNALPMKEILLMGILVKVTWLSVLQMRFKHTVS